MEYIVHIRCVPEDEIVSLSIYWNEKTLTLSRNKGEAMKATFGRIRIKLGLKETECLQVENENGEIVSEDEMIGNSFIESNRLNIRNDRLSILVNMPRVVGLSYGLYPIVHCRIFPQIELEFSDINICSWKWERKDSITNSAVIVGTEQSYVPTEEDVGYALSVECTPRVVTASEVLRAGIPISFQLQAPAPPKKKSSKAGAKTSTESSLPSSELSPMSPYLVSRYNLNTEIFHRCDNVVPSDASRNSLRVMTYNILLDAFCDNKWALENVYPYVQFPYANINIRKQVLMWEMLQYGADVICLQEVAEDLFNEYLAIHFRFAGYEGVYCNKISQNKVGSAIFVKSKCLSIEESNCIDLTQCWNDDTTIFDALAPYPSIVDRFQRTTTVSQCVVLRRRERDMSEKRFVVINCHLFSNPQAAHFRILQAALTLNFVAKTYPTLPAIFCADLNADRSSGVYEYLSTGHISASHPEWAEGFAFGELDSNTQEERQLNWHLVMGDADVQMARKLFTLVDQDCCGEVSWSQLVQQFHLSLTETDISSLQIIFLAANCHDQFCYARVFLALSKAKQQLTEVYYQIFHCIMAQTQHDEAHLLSVSTLRDGSVEPFISLPLDHAFNFFAACDASEITFFAGRQPSGCRLDHILVDQRTFELVESLSQPKPILPQTIVSSGGLPNAEFPSDHVSLLADIEWISA